MEIIFKVAVITTLVAVSTCQVVSFKGCPKVSVQRNFNIEQYMGRWYEMERYFAIFEAFQDCVTADYSLDPSGVVIVNNSGYSHKFWDRGYTSIIGNATVEDPKNPAKLGVRFFEKQPRGDYWVLSTDYTSYTVIWSCTEVDLGIFGKFNSQFAWILTRQPEGISAAKQRRIVKFLEGYGIRTSKFSKTNQSSCPGR